MSNVFLSVYGDGTAYTDAVPPLVNGEEFTVYCTPDAGATLEDVRAWTSHDESIAITPSAEVHFTYNSAWNNVYVDVYFSGVPIPDPEPPSPARKWPWLFAKAAQKWRM